MSVQDMITSDLPEVHQYAILPHHEQIALARRAKAGDREARDLLVLHNLRMVLKVIRPFVNEGRAEFEDLYHEGVAGLVDAVNRFDPERGVTFGTYAMWWIRQSVGIHVYQQNTAYVPRHTHDLVVRVRKHVQQGITDPVQIAQESGAKLAHVQQALEISRTRYVSLDQQTAEEDGETFGFYLADESDDYADVDEQLSPPDVSRYFAALTEKEQQVARLLYGFDGEEMTVEQVRKELGVSRQRADQLRLSALKKMRRAAGVEIEEQAS